jgi:hypothetical protein
MKMPLELPVQQPLVERQELVFQPQLLVSLAELEPVPP